jgi:hypothetical protein
VQAATGSDRVTVRARVWAEGSAEPEDWQAEAYDASGTRITAGAVGVRTYGPGSKYFDDLVVMPLPSYTTTTRVITYTYDKLYRLTDADYSSGEAFTYGYDPVGNRTIQTRTLTSTTVITYAYDAANWLDYFYEDGVLTDLGWDANPLCYAAGTSWQLANSRHQRVYLGRRQPSGECKCSWRGQQL